MQLKTNGNNKRKNEKKSDRTKWSDDEVNEFIELLEEWTCLWDIHSKRELREKAYSEIAEHFDSTSASVKTKINAFRAQLGREIEKESKTKSGQATSKWVFYDQLQCLRSAMASSKSRDSICVYDTENDFDVP